MSDRRQLKRRGLRIETLESRYVFDASASAAAGLPWFDLNELTFSFAPDGTEMGQHASSLFAELAPTGTTEQWQGEFQRALDDWISALGATAHLVADSGDPFGTFGKTQGDIRFGDIRIGAVPLSNNVMAEAIPHAVITQGSWAGDILLNTNADWSNLQQVYSVALHEIGHVLGLDHSDDPASPMYFHGVYATDGPTAGDLAALKKLYAGVNVEADDIESFDPADYEWNDEGEFPFDANAAIPLQASVSSSARYSANGQLNAANPYLLYRLDPLGEIDHAKYLNIVVSADQFGGLFPVVKIYDASGDPLPFKTLHYTSGVLVIQASKVEPSETYFVAVSPAATAVIHQSGGFEMLAEYSLTELLPAEVARFELTEALPILEQPFSVNTSRLVHVLLESDGGRHPSAVAAIWATLVDSEDRVIAQLGMNEGDVRSLPLVFLEPGDYRVIVQAGTSDGSQMKTQKLLMYIDEISIDVGPGVINPALQPVLTCGSLGADPNNCTNTPPVVVDAPVTPDPTTLPPSPFYPSIPPFSVPSWHFWPLASYRQNPLNPLDVSGNSIVSPTDALLVINLLNSRIVKWDHAYDTNGDGRASPSDALLVINYLNSRAQGEGEGERQASQSFSMSQSPHSPLSADFYFDVEYRKQNRLF